MAKLRGRSWLTISLVVFFLVVADSSSVPRGAAVHSTIPLERIGRYRSIQRTTPETREAAALKSGVASGFNRTFETDHTMLPTALSNARTRRARALFRELPLHFEVNRGQTDSAVKFLSRGPGYTLFLTETETVLVSTRVSNIKSDRPQKTRTSLRMSFVGANSNPDVIGQRPLPSKANYFVGNDPTRWRTNVSTYESVRYSGIYKGIDAVYYGNQRNLEYDLIVAPGSDPNQIAVHFNGADRLEIDPSGDLLLHTALGAIRQQRPSIYQDAEGGRREIRGGYALIDTYQVRFDISDYDRSLPLVIDPTLIYSTYLGGSGSDEGSAIAIDASGQVYVTGTTGSADFPVTGGTFSDSDSDAFVAALTADGSSLQYSTYIGGSGRDEGEGIVLDAEGRVYVVGLAGSADFPLTLDAYQPTFGGGEADAYFAVLSADGSALEYSTYLGGSDFDEGGGIALDSENRASLTGRTLSSDFPTTSGVVQPTFGGVEDAFLTRFWADRSNLDYSTYLGGDSRDEGESIAVDSDGRAYVTGVTTSENFPTTPGSFQPGLGGGSSDAFVSKLFLDGSGLDFSTFLGGSGDLDEGSDIAIDAMGRSYVTGRTDSMDFPTTSGAVQPTLGGAMDAFVAKLSASGQALEYSSYVGGTGIDEGEALAIDPSGRVYLTGFTESADFPTTAGAFQSFLADQGDAFVTMVDPAGSALQYSTFFGGSGRDVGEGLAIDAVGHAYVIGTYS